MPYCPQCGNKVSNAANFCKACGFNLKSSEIMDGGQPYKDNKLEMEQTPTSNETAEKEAGKARLRWGAVVVGGILGIIAQLILGFLVGLTVSDANDTSFLVAIIIIGLVSFILAGFIAGAITGYRGATHGMLAATLTCVLGIITNLATGWY